MKKIYLIFFLIILIFFNCSTNILKKKYKTINGIFSNENFYSDLSFFDKETVKNTLLTNEIDFWCLSISNEEDKQIFKTKIKKLQNKYIKNKFFVYNKMLNDNNIFDNTQKTYFQTKNNDKKILELHRDLNLNILYNIATVKENGTLIDYYNDYINFLDRGFILAPIVNYEIHGPEWKINNDIRNYVLCSDNSIINFKKSIYNRKIFISYEKGVDLFFSINNYEIGDINSNYNFENLKFNITIESIYRKIKQVLIYSNNNQIVFNKENINSNNLSINGEINSLNSYNYYICYVIFENGNYAFTSPIWFYNDKKFLINNIQQKPALIDNKKCIEFSFNIENISKEIIRDLNIEINSSENKFIYRNKIDLKKGEIFLFNNKYCYDSTKDEILNIFLNKDSYSISNSIKINKNYFFSKILFDISHNNIFAKNLEKLNKYLQQMGFITHFEKNKELIDNYNFLKGYNILFITVPEEIFKVIEPEMKFFETINKYVQNGGIIILCAYNDEKTQSSIIFFNEILRVVYAPIRFKIDNKYRLAYLIDKENNFNNIESIPVFTNFNNNIIDQSSNIKKIYLRNPIEFYGQYENSDISLRNLYNVESIVNYNPTTVNILEKYSKSNEKSVCVIYKFGSGKVLILSGINFTDYDIDHLNNKEFILFLIKYLLS